MKTTDHSPTVPAPDGTGGATALCILGMHRSGTSALARVVNLLGVDLGETFLEPSVDNPKGFWEQPEIVDAHDELFDACRMGYDHFLPMPEGWSETPAAARAYERAMQVVRTRFGGSPLWGFKDPRTCRTLPVWRHVFRDVGADHRHLFVVRSPDEIARSLAVRNGYGYNKSLLLALVYLCEAEGSTRDRPRVVVTYDELMSDWRGTCERAAAGLGIAWPVAYEAIAGQVGQFLDPALRHHASGGEAQPSAGMRNADPAVRRWVTELHEVFLAAAVAGGSLDSRRVEAIYGEYLADLPRLAEWHEGKSLIYAYHRVEAWGANLDRANKALMEENEALRVRAAVAGLDAGRNVLKLTPPDPLVRTGPKPGEGEGEGGADEPAAPQTTEDLADLVERLGASNAALQAAAAASAARVAELIKADEGRAVEMGAMETRVRQLELDRRWYEQERDAARAELARSSAPQTLERLSWLESHVEALEASGRELAAGNEWLREELRKSGAEVEHRGAEVERLRAWIAELDGARAWLTEELEKAKTVVESRDAAVAHRDARIAELSARLDEQVREKAPAVAP